MRLKHHITILSRPLTCEELNNTDKAANLLESGSSFFRGLSTLSGY